MTGESLSTTVRALADKEEIRELTARYADSVWRRDPESAVELFAEDGVLCASPLRMGRERGKEMKGRSDA